MIGKSANAFASPIEAPDRLESSVSYQESPTVDRRRIQARELLWEHRGLLLRSALCGLILAAVVAFLIPVQYESTVRLMPPDQTNSSGLAMLSALTSKAGDAPAMGIASDLLGMKSSGALFVAILRSRTAQDGLVNRFDLRKVYWVSHWEDARKKLGDRTSVSEDRKSGVITISVSDHDRQRAAALAQAYVDQLNTLVAQLSTSSARRERMFLEARLKEVKQDLDSAAVEFSQFASKHTTIDMPAQSKAMVESAAALQGELIAAQSELSGLEQIYSANNVRVRSVKAKVEELQRQLDIVGGKDLSDTDDGKLYPSIRELPLLGVGYADLYRKLKIRETVYEYLTRQYELARVQEAKEIPTVRVLDPPNVPETKSFPPRLLFILLGVAIAICVSSTWVIGAHSWASLDERDDRKLMFKRSIEELRILRHRFTNRRPSSVR